MMSCVSHLKGAETGETRGSKWAMHTLCVLIMPPNSVLLIYNDCTKMFHVLNQI